MVARAFLTPATFGEYGWYRGAALEELAARTPVYAGKKACDECHSDILHKWPETPTRRFLRGVPWCEPDACRRSGCAAGETDRQPLHPVSRSQSVPAGLVQADRREGPLQRQVHGVSHPPSADPKPMKTRINRRNALARLGGALAGVLALSAARTAKAAIQKVFVSTGAARGYDPSKHKWLMCIDVNKCIGCGLCAEACKKENGVPEGPYFRTWIERYIIPKPKPGSGLTRGETLVDCPNGGMHGFPEAPLPRNEIEHSFFVPKLCNLCVHSPCVQVCPVGGDVRRAGRRGADRPEVLHRLRILHPGLPVRLPVSEPGDQDGREVLAVLPSHHARSQAGMRGDLSDPGAYFRGTC